MTNRSIFMKPAIFIALLLSVSFARSQGMTDVEKQLIVDYRQIDYWRSHIDLPDTIDWVDSLGHADTTFHEQLTKILNKYPESLDYDFPALRDSGFVITTSNDGCFRIYAWDNESGGSMRYFDHVLQYKTNSGTRATSLTGTAEDQEIGWYLMISPFRTKKSTYYLAFSRSQISGSGRVETVSSFKIDKDSLLGPIKLFKKGNQRQDNVGLEFMSFSFPRVPALTLQTLVYDTVHHTIKVPQLDDLFGNPTGHYTLYRWTGKYFYAK